MLEVNEDFWGYPADYRCIPTNGVLNTKGGLVMGAGLAKVAADKFPGLAAHLGKWVSGFGNKPCVCWHIRLISFPTKHHWKDKSDIVLIENSAREIQDISPLLGKIVLPKVGCGLGGLEWNDVRPVLARILDDNFIVTLGKVA